MFISMTCFKTWIDPGLGPALSRRGSMTWLVINFGSPQNWGTAMKWVIMFPSLLRSARSYLFHIRFSGKICWASTAGSDEVRDTGDRGSVDSWLVAKPSCISSTSMVSSTSSFISHARKSSFSLSSISLLGAALVQSSWELFISLDLVPKLSPNRFVVGVPVTIHLLSTLSSLAKGTKVVDKVADTWPSSMTRRFHRICNKGDTSVVWQRQMGTRVTGNSSQEQGFQECSLETSRELASNVNSAKKLQYIVHVLKR